jgi:hypothetical protein
VHGTEHVVELAVEEPSAFNQRPNISSKIAQAGKLANHLHRRQRHAWIGDAPAHEQHEEEAEQQENQTGDGVLDADGLVIRGEDVFPQEARLMVIVRMVMRVIVGVSWVAAALMGSFKGQSLKVQS